MTDLIRRTLRESAHWVQFQELNREGWAAAARRRRIQRRMLKTPPMRTEREGSVEIRVLTWRRDWINLLWALKSFYHFAGVRWPLFVHDGGLMRGQARQINNHFPHAHIVTRPEADTQVESHFRSRGFNRCLEYRRLNSASAKIFDFFVLSRAQRIVSIDSDIIFYRRPDELLRTEDRISRFNRDCTDAYSIPIDELAQLCGTIVPPRINSGLFSVCRDSVDFDQIERWLSHPGLFANRWVTEQTLHAMSAARRGVELLSDAYIISTEPGLSDGAVCKHYPGYFRPLLYAEGMASLINRGFLNEIRR